ncbi:MAG: hypothetical protein JXA64_06435 [Candidatus Fermentibacteraceae bacterium]|nr:hypothetical protein [Candidatus Fermentibacteraceae bacterium]MBN2608734.1 hypothetical protein [Candidatus Fermentibacteraceae bacterium]
MKWKVEVLGKSPSEVSVRVLNERTGLPVESILLLFSRDEKVVSGGFSETEAQELADRLKRDKGISVRVLPDSEVRTEPVPLFRVLLVNYRPGYRTRLRRRLQELTRLPQDQIILWLSRMPFVLSKGVDSEAARRIKRSVTEAGGIVRVETETPFQESLSERRKSNAVFRSWTHAGEEEDASDSLFRKEPEKAQEAAEEVPPVADLPDGFQAEPPPLDIIETDGGVVIMYPPARFAVGAPAVSHIGDYRLEPPVLPDTSVDAVPHVLEFLPPEAPSTDPPPVVGTREHSPWAEEPAPDVVCLFPPPSGIDTDRLLPPVLGEREESQADLFGDEAGTETGTILTEAAASGTETPLKEIEESDEETGAADFKIARNLEEISGGRPLRLFLCRPAPEDEDTVAEALRDVMGVSLRESWDLLRKAPLLLREYLDHTSAILAVHQLESRGVSVSLSRGESLKVLRSNGEGEGFRAWLAKNG